MNGYEPMDKAYHHEGYSCMRHKYAIRINDDYRSFVEKPMSVDGRTIHNINSLMAY
jgi:hypothetical protein